MCKFIATTFLLVMCAISTAEAELVFYGGTRTDAYTGENHGTTVKWKMILLVDYNNAQVAEISYAVINNNKHYFSSTFTNAHFVTVTGKSSSSTVIAHMPSQCELDSGQTSEGVYCFGINANLTLDVKTTISFPKTFTSRGGGLSYSTSNGQPILDEGLYQLNFDQRSTLSSNQSGETYDAAIAKMTAYLESLGYTQ